METLNELFRQLVPEHYDGLTITAQSSTSTASGTAAQDIFDQARARLLDIGNWFALNEKLGAVFVLTDPDGNPLPDALAGPGLLIRIEIPGPDNKKGDGYDWVRIEEIADLGEEGICGIGIRVRPAPEPGDTVREVAHFYDHQSTSSFFVYKAGCMVKAMVVDRNTKINTASGGLLDKIRNMIVGTGAITLFSKIQWKHLCENLLKEA